mmetsp:Transcript_11871/g.28802  ORF Transcript_11871/g.28802 Transcript_11871/m.28802 type:complete len:213 (+) Transcript_11871:16-654(+)
MRGIIHHTAAPASPPMAALGRVHFSNPAHVSYRGTDPFHVFYQIPIHDTHHKWQRSAGFIFDPTGHEKVSAKGANCERVPMTRNFAGGCGSVRSSARAATFFSRWHHVWPIAMKKRRFASASGFAFSKNASHDILSPPASAIASPSVRFPFTCLPSNLKDEKSVEMQLARSLKPSITAGVHHPLRFPSASYSRPISSNPCVISCPQMAPDEP